MIGLLELPEELLGPAGEDEVVAASESESGGQRSRRRLESPRSVWFSNLSCCFDSNTFLLFKCAQLRESERAAAQMNRQRHGEVTQSVSGCQTPHRQSEEVEMFHPPSTFFFFFLNRHFIKLSFRTERLQLASYSWLLTWKKNNLSLLQSALTLSTLGIKAS